MNNKFKMVTQINDSGILVYGIASSDLTSVVYDITNDYAVIKRLVDKFNSYDLSTEHLNDAVDDFINE